MGSREAELLTAQQAADMLNVSVGMVHKMVRQGRLHPVHAPGQRRRYTQYFRPSDVAAVAATRYEKLEPEKVANMAMRALALAQSNERKLQELTFLLGLDTAPLKTSEEEVLALHVRAQDALENDEYRPHSSQVIDWARTFFALSEEYLRLVSHYTGSNEPWKVYVDLSQKLSETAPRSLFHGDKQLESAYGYLEASRRHLRALAYLSMRMKTGPKMAARAFPELEGGVDEEMIRLLFLH